MPTHRKPCRRSNAFSVNRNARMPGAPGGKRSVQVMVDVSGDGNSRGNLPAGHAAKALRASERMRSTIERKPFERCGVR